MTETDRSAHPSTDAFPFYLEVNDNHDPDDGICHYPREGYARLSYWNPETGYTRVSEYIQEQNFPTDRPTERKDIHAFMFPYELGSPETDRPGWETGPTALWDFIETVRDDYYEYGLATMPDGQVEVTDQTSQAELGEAEREKQLSEKLPIRVITNRTKVDNPGPDDYDEHCEIYFRNGANDVEYLMWNSNELYGPADNSVGYVVDSKLKLIQTVITAVARAYEEPEEFLKEWRPVAVKLD